MDTAATTVGTLCQHASNAYAVANRAYRDFQCHHICAVANRAYRCAVANRAYRN